ncbi:MAG: metal-sulfur cluster assembly factor [Armatimonadetes bacterium]|nr:metal-sulfur cluster assembly factor [Armatimonadota bacterium]
MSKEEALQHLSSVLDPELGINVVDLGLIEDIRFQEGSIHVLMLVTTPGCPMQETLAQAVKGALEGRPGVDAVRVTVLSEPMWTPARISSGARALLGWR